MTAPNARLLPSIPDLAERRRVHVIGLCGTAMGTLGAMLRERGYTVTGSDAMAYPPMSTWLEARGMAVRSGYAAEHIPADCQLVVVGNVARRDNAEVLEAARRGLPTISLPEALRVLFLAGRQPLVVTGTHGKTTTTAMTTWMLREAGLRPSMFVGGVTVNFDASYVLDEGAHFVVEGDEYDSAYFDKVPKFWHYPAWAATVNNVEFDHADIYRDLGEIEHVFGRFAEQVDPRGELWVNGDDAVAMRVTRETWATRRTFGLGKRNDLRGDVRGQDDAGIHVDVWLDGANIGEVTVPVVGTHNVRNFLGASGLCVTAGVKPGDLAQCVAGFRGVKRRQQRLGEAAGVVVYDDFAHHPTAVRETLAAIAARHPGRRLVCAFEAKSNTSRRAVFQADYPPAFGACARVWIAAPWKKDDLPPEQLLDMDRLVRDIDGLGARTTRHPDVDELMGAVLAELEPGDVFVALSGSAFGDLPARVLGALEARGG